MKVIYPGSFDPFTNGHKDVVRRAIRHNFGVGETLEKFYICIAENDEKESAFTPEERKEMIEIALSNHPQRDIIEVIIYDGLIVDLAKFLGASYIIRGIRANRKDRDEEELLAQTNKRLSKIRGFTLETIPIYAHDEFLDSVSSSLVKKLCKLGEYIEVSRLVSPNIHQELMVKSLYKYFASNSCLLQNTINWLELTKIYKSRAYHNLSHLGYMFNMLSIYSSQTGFVASRDFILAIIGHDLVYEPLNDDNEEASYEMLTRWLPENNQLVWNASETKKLILATKYPSNIEKPTEEEALIMDLDLSILGTFHDKIWQNYCDNVRKEYSFVSDEVFNKGRIEFLRTLLNSERIFKTDTFYKMFEENARKNIANEIKRLQA